MNGDFRGDCPVCKSVDGEFFLTGMALENFIYKCIFMYFIICLFYFYIILFLYGVYYYFHKTRNNIIIFLFVL
jgi:hypothetical protein